MSDFRLKPGQKYLLDPENPYIKAIAKIEATTKRDLKRVEGWKDISSGVEFPQIVWCCLNRYNPDVTLNDVLNYLNPAAQHQLADALFELSFPGILEAVKKHKETEGTSPNAPMAETQTALKKVPEPGKSSGQSLAMTSDSVGKSSET
jgi:hypothetical protein